MYKLVLAPDVQDYRISEKSEVLSWNVQGGPSRFRRDLIGTSYRVKCSWSLTQAEFVYFKKFYKAIYGGQQSFNVDLALDFPYTLTYVANFFPGTLQFSEQSGDLYKISAELEVVQGQYILPPLLLPRPGTYVGAIQLSMMTPTANTWTFYGLNDGIIDTAYVSPITIAVSTTVFAEAATQGVEVSPTVRAVYTIR